MSQLFQDDDTVCHCWTNFKVKIQLDHLILVMEAKLMSISFFGPNLGYSQDTRDEEG